MKKWFIILALFSTLVFVGCDTQQSDSASSDTVLNESNNTQTVDDNQIEMPPSPWDAINNNQNQRVAKSDRNQFPPGGSN